MSYNVSFISLGCAKNQVNCEQMMALCAEAGYSIQAQPEGCDVVVVNTCGFLASACEEAIENILEMAELKKAGQVKKILVTGCMTQRYKEDIFHELPEVDGLLGTGSYGDIATAIAEVMEKGEKPCHLGNIHTANQSGERILSTPPWYAYLRIAEGCDNHCAYCVIPSLRGKYRSRPMNELLDEAAELASAGVTALDLGLDEQVGAADAPLGAGILALGVGDVVDHHSHRAAVGAALGAGEDVGVVLGQGRDERFALGRRGDGHVAGSFRRSSSLPFFGQALEQAGQLAAQRGASSRRAAGQGQRCRCQPGNMKDRPTRDFHDKTASYQKAPPHTGRDSAFCFDCTVSRPICKEKVAARISASQRGDSKTGFYKRNGCSPGGGLCAAERHFFALSSCFFGAGVVI